MDESLARMPHERGDLYCRHTTVLRTDRRCRVCRPACADGGCEKLKCRQALADKIQRASHVPDDASQDERHHRGGPTLGSWPASGNKLRFRRGSGRLGLCPMSGECNRQCSANRSQHGARSEMQPRLTRRSGKFESLTDAPEYVAHGDAAGVAFVNGSS